jgi:hypothetical protein
MSDEARVMSMTMCKRVGLSHRVGTYILAMRRIENPLPGGMIDMVEVAQIIKYASEHQEDLKPQFKDGQTTEMPKPEKPPYFIFLK